MLASYLLTYGQLTNYKLIIFNELVDLNVVELDEKSISGQIFIVTPS